MRDLLMQRSLVAGGVVALSFFPCKVLAQTMASKVTDKAALHKTASGKKYVLSGVRPGSEHLSVRMRPLTHGTREVLSRRLLEQQVPGTNPLKALAQLPGIQFQSDDPQGLDSYANQVYMHGFMQNELGASLDGMPLGELGFRNYNGLSAVQAISSENIARVDVTQSAGAESTPSTNNLGGSIIYSSVLPTEKPGAVIAQSFGSNALYHSFFRFDSGRLNRTGSRFFVSYMRNDTDKWKGGGGQFMQQVNAGFLQPIGEKSKITAYFDWDSLNMVNYQDYTPGWLRHNGRYLDNFYGKRNGWSRAYQASQGIYPPGYENIQDPKDVSYYDSTASSGDVFGHITADMALTQRLKWKTSFYGHHEAGHGTYANPYACTDPSASPCPEAQDTIRLNGGRIFEQVRKPAIERFGGLTSLEQKFRHTKWGQHIVSAGIWYENNHYTTYAFAYQQPLPGQGQPLNPFGSFAHVPRRTLWGQEYNTNSFTGFVQDDIALTPSLFLHVGFKSVLATSRVGHGVNWPLRFPAQTSGESLTTSRAFLPHVSLDYRFLRHHEVFFDASENVHAYPLSGYNSSNSPLAVSQAAYNAVRGRLKPETAWTYALGYRYQAPMMQGSLYLYRTNFNNRLQQISGSGSFLTNNTTTVQNVGGVTMNGVDAGLTFTPLSGLSLTNNVSYNDATYDRDMTSGGVTYATKGRQVVAYPKFMYKTRLAYTWHDVTASVDAQYMGRRSYDYVGDYKIPGYWVSNFGLFYTLYHIRPRGLPSMEIHKLVISFNIYNLANKAYISTMGQNGFTMDNRDGAAMNNQSVLIGAPRQFFGSVRAEF